MGRIIISILFIMLNFNLFFGIEYEYMGKIISGNWGNETNEFYFMASEMGTDYYPQSFFIDIYGNIHIADGSLTGFSNQRVKIYNKFGELIKIIDLRDQPYVEEQNWYNLSPIWITEKNEIIIEIGVKYRQNNLGLYLIFDTNYLYLGSTDEPEQEIQNKRINVLAVTTFSHIDSLSRQIALNYSSEELDWLNVAIVNNHQNLLGIIDLPEIKRDYTFESEFETDFDGNVYVLRRDDNGIYILKYEKIDYLPATPSSINATKYLFTDTGGELASLDKTTGTLQIGERRVQLQDYSVISPAWMGFDADGNLYIKGVSNIYVYSINSIDGKPLYAEPIEYFPEDRAFIDEGLVIKYMDTNDGMLKYKLFSAEGAREVDETYLRIGGFDVIDARIQIDQYGREIVNGIDIRLNGESIRTFKYGGDTVIYKKVIAIDNEGYLWIRVIYRSAEDGKAYGEVLKFDQEGNFENAIYLDDETGFNAKSQVVVVDERTVYIVDWKRLVRMEKEEIEGAPIDGE